jgi:hypothetical protein
VLCGKPTGTTCFRVNSHHIMAANGPFQAAAAEFSGNGATARVLTSNELLVCAVMCCAVLCR